MDYLAMAPAREARGVVRAPPSKSATNRALLLAALSPTPVELVRPLDSEDTRVLARCLRALGASIEESGAGLRVQGPVRGRGSDQVLLDAGESGTAARFLAALAAATPGRFLLDGSPGLRGRPMRELTRALRSIGGAIVSRGEDDGLPLEIGGGTLRSGIVSVDASRSSQFVSALLLAAVAVEGGLEVHASGRVASAPYVGSTLDALEAFGHAVFRGPALRVERGPAAAGRYGIPGDYSSALPLLAAPGILGGEVRVEGLAWPSRDADAIALEALQRMGMTIVRGEEGTVVGRAPRARLTGLEVVATDFPDAVPVLAALALFAGGESRIQGIAHLRWKESDRLEAVTKLLQAAGGAVERDADALTIRGAPLEAGSRALPTAGDHRIVMAAALVALGRPGALIERPDHVAKSYPRFFADLESLLAR
ncbi:MAG: 3-phosphoshikimate 1-carboxyvinyltransferase [Thermoanaerobaculia bacterium]